MPTTTSPTPVDKETDLATSDDEEPQEDPSDVDFITSAESDGVRPKFLKTADQCRPMHQNGRASMHVIKLSPGRFLPGGPSIFGGSNLRSDWEEVERCSSCLLQQSVMKHGLTVAVSAKPEPTPSPSWSPSKHQTRAHNFASLCHRGGECLNLLLVMTHTKNNAIKGKTRQI